MVRHRAKRLYLAATVASLVACARTVTDPLSEAAPGSSLNGPDYPGDAAIFIRQAVAPIEHPEIPGTCFLPVRHSTAALESGTLDVALRDTYHLGLQIQNHVPATGPRSLEVATLERFEIDLRRDRPHGPRVVGDAPFTTFSTTAVTLAEGGVPGLGLAYLEALPASVVQGLRDEVCAIDRRDVSAACPIPRVRSHPLRVIVRVTAHGRSRGMPLSLPTFSFPLTLCCGCLVAFSAAADLAAPEHPGPDCLAALPPGVAPACTPGQDEPLDCRRCAQLAPEFCQPRGFQSSVPTLGGGAQRVECPTDR